MINPSIIILIIGYFISIVVLIITFNHVLKNKSNYGSKLNIILLLITLVICVPLHSTIFILSIIFFYSVSINLLLWRISILLGFITLMFVCVIYSFLKEFKKISYFTFLYFSTLLGLLIGTLSAPSSIKMIKSSNYTIDKFTIISDTNRINYIFSFPASLIIIIFQCSIVIYMIYTAIVVNKRSRNKSTSQMLIINTFIFAIPLLLYIFYVLYGLTIYRELHILLLWVNIAGVEIALVKKPDMFLILTNKVYAVNIYHKSGILLYSYEFKSAKFEIDSTSWGKIIIGLNHIISEFTETNDKIDAFKTRNADIIINYNNEYGFAIIVITNSKNEILDRFIENFTKEFIEKHKSELSVIQDLNKIINVAEFKAAKELVEKHFNIYLY